MLELRSEFLCTLTGRVAPARDIGTGGYGHRRFFGAVRGSFGLVGVLLLNLAIK